MGFLSRHYSSRVLNQTKDTYPMMSGHESTGEVHSFGRHFCCSGFFFRQNLSSCLCLWWLPNVIFTNSLLPWLFCCQAKNWRWRIFMFAIARIGPVSPFTISCMYAVSRATLRLCSREFTAFDESCGPTLHPLHVVDMFLGMGSPLFHIFTCAFYLLELYSSYRFARLLRKL